MINRKRRSIFSVLMKIVRSLLCRLGFYTVMISFCLLLYIPIYVLAHDQLVKAQISGWSPHTNRDTKLYVLPNNITTIHEPTHICPKDITKTSKVLLLIIVCSAIENFDHRIVIRNTWGNAKKYIELTKIFLKIRERYKSYNFTYDLVKEIDDSWVKGDANITRLLPELVEVMQSNLVTAKTDSVSQKSFQDDSTLSKFEMNKGLEEKITNNYNSGYESNIMKIPSNFPKIQEVLKANNTEVDFKLAFLLGLPANRYDIEMRLKIEKEIEKYGDVIQEDFIDSYNNLTLKSIMMLKWINNKCNESVRYILKTDDDIYINIPNMVMNLQTRSKHFDSQSININKKEYLLIGNLISGAKPALDNTDKWYTPRYMYSGRVYPTYLSGSAYLFSAAAARALYDAALKTPYFYLEDIYITGICAGAASPLLVPQNDEGYWYKPRQNPCAVHANLNAHRVTPTDMAELARVLADEQAVDRCERIRLTKVRKNRLSCITIKKRKVKQNIDTYF